MVINGSLKMTVIRTGQDIKNIIKTPIIVKIKK